MYMWTHWTTSSKVNNIKKRNEWCWHSFQGTRKQQKNWTSITNTKPGTYLTITNYKDLQIYIFKHAKPKRKEKKRARKYCLPINGSDNQRRRRQGFLSQESNEIKEKTNELSKTILIYFMLVINNTKHKRLKDTLLRRLPI